MYLDLRPHVARFISLLKIRFFVDRHHVSAAAYSHASSTTYMAVQPGLGSDSGHASTGPSQGRGWQRCGVGIRTEEPDGHDAAPGLHLLPCHATCKFCSWLYRCLDDRSVHALTPKCNLESMKSSCAPRADVSIVLRWEDLSSVLRQLK